MKVIFDVDGLLLNTEKVGRGVMKEILAEVGKSVSIDVEFLNSLRGRRFEENVEKIVAKFGLEFGVEEFAKVYKAKLGAKLADPKNIDLLPGAEKLIRHVFLTFTIIYISILSSL